MGGLIGSMLAGGLEGAGNAGVRLGLAEHDAIIQRERAARAQEFQKELEGMRQSGADRRLNTTESGADRRLNMSQEGAAARQKDAFAHSEAMQQSQQGFEAKQNVARESVYLAHARYYDALTEKAREIGVDKTALISNISFLVDSGIAKNKAEAFEKLRTSMAKPEDAQVSDITKYLLRGSGYRGADGRKRAIQDAKAMIQSMRSGDDKTWSQVEQDRAALKGAPGGKIIAGDFTDEDVKFTAMKHGISEDEVLRRLGVK